MFSSSLWSRHLEKQEAIAHKSPVGWKVGQGVQRLASMEERSGQVWWEDALGETDLTQAGEGMRFIQKDYGVGSMRVIFTPPHNQWKTLSVLWFVAAVFNKDKWSEQEDATELVNIYNNWICSKARMLLSIRYDHDIDETLLRVRDRWADWTRCRFSSVRAVHDDL